MGHVESGGHQRRDGQRFQNQDGEHDSRQDPAMLTMDAMIMRHYYSVPRQLRTTLPESSPRLFRACLAEAHLHVGFVLQMHRIDETHAGRGMGHDDGLRAGPVAEE